MGGGNTYALLMRLRRSGLLAAIRRRVRAGLPYVGASAGSNVAGPTILTTNDWNVVGVPRFDALGLVGFNINPHYKEADPLMAAGSETRDDRIREYHVVNRNPVVGARGGRAGARRGRPRHRAGHRAHQALPARVGARLVRAGRPAARAVEAVARRGRAE